MVLHRGCPAAMTAQTSQEPCSGVSVTITRIRSRHTVETRDAVSGPLVALAGPSAKVPVRWRWPDHLVISHADRSLERSDLDGGEYPRSLGEQDCRPLAGSQGSQRRRSARQTESRVTGVSLSALDDRNPRRHDKLSAALPAASVMRSPVEASPTAFQEESPPWRHGRLGWHLAEQKRFEGARRVVGDLGRCDGSALLGDAQAQHPAYASRRFADLPCHGGPTGTCGLLWGVRSRVGQEIASAVGLPIRGARRWTFRTDIACQAPPRLAGVPVRLSDFAITA